MSVLQLLYPVKGARFLLVFSVIFILLCLIGLIFYRMETGSQSYFPSFTSQKRPIFSLEPSSCLLPDGRPPIMVLFVSSRPNATVMREAIRDTWGATGTACSVRIIFGFGAVNQLLLPLNVTAQESATYRDILQVANVRDGYRNQTRLVLAWFAWARDNCPLASTRYLAKADDDTWINFREILPALEAISQASTAYVAGYFFPNGTTVIRDADHPQSLSKEERWDDYYPAYSSGAFYAFPFRLVEAILTTAAGIKIHWIDDAFITGDVIVKMNQQAGRVDKPVQQIRLKGLAQMPDFQTSSGCHLRKHSMMHKVDHEMKRFLYNIPCLARLQRCRLYC